MRVVVTGGAGFIGSNLVDRLVERGDDVTVIDDLSTGRRENLARAEAGGTRLVEADVRDADAVAEAVAAHRAEAIHHLAAQIDVRRSVADPDFDLAVNVAGTIHVLEAARRSGTGRIVLASTGGAIYGEGAGRPLPLAEDAERRPDAPYGQSKLAAEGYLALYGRLHGISTVALRLGNVYGPREDPLGEAGVVAIFCGALLQGRAPRVFGDGTQTRDYLYVADAADAFIAAADSDAQGAYNVGTGVETSVLELGERLATLCGRDFAPELLPPRPGEIQRIAISSSRASRDFGWEARTALDDGLRLTLDAIGQP